MPAAPAVLCAAQDFRFQRIRRSRSSFLLCRSGSFVRTSPRRPLCARGGGCANDAPSVRSLRGESWRGTHYARGNGVSEVLKSRRLYMSAARKICKINGLYRAKAGKNFAAMDARSLWTFILGSALLNGKKEIIDDYETEQLFPRMPIVLYGNGSTGQR